MFSPRPEEFQSSDCGDLKNRGVRARMHVPCCVWPTLTPSSRSLGTAVGFPLGSFLCWGVPWRARLILCIHVRLALGERHFEVADVIPRKCVPSGMFLAFPPPRNWVWVSLMCVAGYWRVVTLLLAFVDLRRAAPSPRALELASTLGTCSIKMASNPRSSSWWAHDRWWFEPFCQRFPM